MADSSSANFDRDYESGFPSSRVRLIDSFVHQQWIWDTIPTRCFDFVKNYVTSDRYLSDSEVVAGDELEFAKSVNVSGDGKDAWIFDVDETLLFNLPYYELHGYGSEIFDEESFDEYMYLANSPALSASLSLYKELQQLGFTIFVLTGRSEPFRNATEANLRDAGYNIWERLILRGPSDKGKLAVEYKSEKRKELVDEGYRIRGNSGDQWSDLLGYAIAQRSFKLPNPMYYIA
uniref:Acid phosphatase n=1 Tax=Chenopodium quinoa TaxID=63459 RepID=A0A803MPU0_CHEQI